MFIFMSNFKFQDVDQWCVSECTILLTGNERVWGQKVIGQLNMFFRLRPTLTKSLLARTRVFGHNIGRLCYYVSQRLINWHHRVLNVQINDIKRKIKLWKCTNMFFVSECSHQQHQGWGVIYPVQGSPQLLLNLPCEESFSQFLHIPYIAATLK